MLKVQCSKEDPKIKLQGARRRSGELASITVNQANAQCGEFFPALLGLEFGAYFEL